MTKDKAENERWLGFYRELAKEESIRERVMLSDYLKGDERKQLIEEWIDLFMVGR